MVRSGISADLDSHPSTTPSLFLATIQGGYALGVNVTASHNPFYYHGIKLTTQVGLADEDLTRAIEELCDRQVRVLDEPIEGMLRYVSAKEDYIEHILSLIDTDPIQKANPIVVYDALFGAGSRCFSELLFKAGVLGFPLHTDNDPYFGGLEEAAPSPKTLGELAHEVRKKGAIMGLATDGDGDRFGVVDDEGNYLENTDFIALVLDYLFRVRGERGAVIKSVSTSSLIDRIARAYGMEVIESPVGFKNIAKRMVQSRGLVGVEESGGFAYSPNLPDKDGLMADMLALEMRVKEGPFREQVCRLKSHYGDSMFQRIDIPVAENQTDQAFHRAVESLPRSFLGGSTEEESTLDGFKRSYIGDSWVLIRFSGTESKVRLYFESPIKGVFQEMLSWAKTLKGVLQTKRSIPKKEGP
jgi:phosphomannomutase